MNTQNVDYAAILTNSGRKDEVPKPSIFDLLVQENMNSLFRLSFKHCFKWITKYSAFLKRSEKFSDEIYLIFHSSIELLYLKVYDSLFSENFYGLRRHSLTDKKRILSVVLSIIFPYCKAKLDDLFEKLEKNLDEPQSITPSKKKSKYFLIEKKIEQIILKFYPFFHLLWSSFFWLYRFRFMFGLSDFHSPLLSILGVKLVYNLKNNIYQKPNILKKILINFNNLITNLLYFIQFLKWYQDDQENRSFSNEFNVFTTPLKNVINSNSTQDLDLIPPPVLPEKIAKNNFFKNQNNFELCPLCTKKRTNECVLYVSGFVFCYPCIFKFIKAHNRCPITSYPCSTKDIIRIFAS